MSLGEENLRTLDRVECGAGVVMMVQREHTGSGKVALICGTKVFESNATLCKKRVFIPPKRNGSRT
jgi:hypothetical protein